MSLTSFIDQPEIKDGMKPFRPKVPRKISAPLMVEPRSSRYSMVGTAFDYLVRFELQRRAPHAKTRPWIAYSAADLLWNSTMQGGINLLPDIGAEAVGESAHAIVDNAEIAVADHIQNKTPETAQFAELAEHAIRLAKLDPVVRALKLDPRFEIADPEDVEDLLAMLDIVPFDSLLVDGYLFLNPTFGESSQSVGGADADLITGDLLVDFKVTKKGDISVKSLDQLLGYYLLARRQRHVDPENPEIKRVAIYFGRHGHLWVLDVVDWTSQPGFSEFETWFFTRANEPIGQSGL